MIDKLAKIIGAEVTDTSSPQLQLYIDLAKETVASLTGRTEDSIETPEKSLYDTLVVFLAVFIYNNIDKLGIENFNSGVSSVKYQNGFPPFINTLIRKLSLWI